MRHIWTILCKRAILDRPTGNISLIDVIEEITVKEPKQDSEEQDKKVINANFSLVSYWRKSSSNKESMVLKVIEEAPDGEELRSVEKELAIPEKKNKLRIHFAFKELIVTDSGEYLIKVYRRSNQDDYNMVSEMPIEINLQTTDE